MSIVKYFIASCRIRSYWSLCINVHIYCIPIFHLSTILHLSRICVQTTCIYIIYIYIYIMSSRCSPLALSFFLSFFPFFLSLSLSLSLLSPLMTPTPRMFGFAESYRLAQVEKDPFDTISRSLLLTYAIPSYRAINPGLLMMRRS